MSFISKPHDNQFGYKNRTSCTHALFTFKETIIQYVDNNTAFLDSIKAFGNLWRQALYLKLKKNNNSILSTTIILKIILKMYYDKLSSKIRINNVLSKVLSG